MIIKISQNEEESVNFCDFLRGLKIINFRGWKLKISIDIENVGIFFLIFC